MNQLAQQRPVSDDVAIGKPMAPAIQGCAADEDLRPEISVSWWRSQLLGVKPELSIENLPAEPLLDAADRLRRAVSPVLDDLATKLAGTNSAIVLADHRVVVIDRRGTSRAINAEMDRLAILPGYNFGEACVGTNAMGTAAEERRLVRVAGSEHYAEIFKHMSCFGVPLVHPLNRRLMGVLDLSFPRTEEHPLMRSFMEDAGRRIEGLLAEWASLRERAQFECFLALNRRSRRPVLSTMEDAVLLNRWARELDPVDQASLLGAMRDLSEAGHGALLNWDIGEGHPVCVRVHTESDDVRFQGVVLEVLPSQPRRSAKAKAPSSLPRLVGTSSAWTTFCSQSIAAVRTGRSILFTGEPGSGKLAAAQGLHELVGRDTFVVLDLATVLTDGREEWLRMLRRSLTEGQSTVVLRHLDLADGPLSAAIAAEIDRASDSDVLLVGTMTDESPKEAIEPLLHRFCLSMTVPPLRERRDDIEALIRFFLKRHAPGSSLQFHPEALAVIRSSSLPGNIRELETLVKGVVTMRASGTVLPSDLPGLVLGSPPHLTPIEQVEREAIISALRLANGNKSSAAAALGISRPTLYRKMAIYGIERGDARLAEHRESKIVTLA